MGGKREKMVPLHVLCGFVDSMSAPLTQRGEDVMRALHIVSTASYSLFEGGDATNQDVEEAVDTLSELCDHPLVAQLADMV